jgi:hypothetical protein
MRLEKFSSLFLSILMLVLSIQNRDRYTLANMYKYRALYHSLVTKDCLLVCWSVTNHETISNVKIDYLEIWDSKILI